MEQKQLDQGVVIGVKVLTRVEAGINRLGDVQKQEQKGMASVHHLVAAIKAGIEYVRDDWGKPNLADKLEQSLKDKEKELGI